jgi:ADP-ribose pyrophosphatase YjhB (NUDIX family)
LIGGSVELGESHRDAVAREVDEELKAAIYDLRFLAAVENIFRIDGTLGHEIVFLYSGRLDPQPSATDATLTEADGNVVPVVWRSPADADEELPLYPAAAIPFVQRLFDTGDGEGIRT